VDEEFMAAVLLRRRQPPAAAVGTYDHLTTLELAALWVDPTLEDRAEVACCLLVFLQQYLLAWDCVRQLHEGKKQSSDGTFEAEDCCHRVVSMWSVVMASERWSSAPA
jgi:hypothetical protein